MFGNQSENHFHIVFPRGDKSKLCVVGFNDSMHYELNDYKVASRKEFNNRADAVRYAKQLAKKHNLEFEGDEPEDDYLN